MAIEEAISIGVRDVENGIREVRTISEFERKAVKLKTGITIDKYVVQVRDEKGIKWLLWLGAREVRQIKRYIVDNGKQEVGLKLVLEIAEKETEEGEVKKWITLKEVQ